MNTLKQTTLLACALAAFPLSVWAEGDSGHIRGFDDIRRRGTYLREQIDSEISRFLRIYGKANNFSVEIPRQLLPQKLYVVRRPDERDKVGISAEKLDESFLFFLPENLIDDINRRIYVEYVRGFYDWRGGLTPPESYAYQDPKTLGWTMDYFDHWQSSERHYSRRSASKFKLYDLYVRPRGAVGRDLADFQRLWRGIPAKREGLDKSVDSALTYTYEERKELIWPIQKVTDNLDTWIRLRTRVASASESYRTDLETAIEMIEDVTRSWVEEFVEYSAGRKPEVRFLADFHPTESDPGNSRQPPLVPSTSGTSPWQHYFDHQVLEGLPKFLRYLVVERMIDAYFKGAEHAKFTTDSSPPVSGTGEGYSFNDSYSVTYGYGSVERYDGSNVDGSRRTGRSWERTPGSGEGSDQGPSGTDGSGIGGEGPGFNDLFGAGAGPGS